jgi:UMP-CMP kinase
MINTKIKNGEIVHSNVTVRLLETAMATARRDGGQRKFIIDGFPRNLSKWGKLMGDAARVVCVLFLECAEEVMLERIMQRGRTSGREDDNPETARKRFRTFHDESMPAVERLSAQRGLVRRISSLPAADEVYGAVRTSFLRSRRVPGPAAVLARSDDDGGAGGHSLFGAA